MGRQFVTDKQAQWVRRMVKFMRRHGVATFRLGDLEVHFEPEAHRVSPILDLTTKQPAADPGATPEDAETLERLQQAAKLAHYG